MDPLLSTWTELVGDPCAKVLTSLSEDERASSFMLDPMSLLMRAERREEVPIEDRLWVKAAEGRFEACSRYAWAIPSPEAIEVIASFGPVIEVGAGTGYWARRLWDAGCDVIATDLNPPVLLPGREPEDMHRPQASSVSSPTGNHWHRSGALYHPMSEDDAAVAAAEHPDRTLLLVWPPYNHDMAFRAARAHLDAGGTTVAYVGEGYGGCTADDAFHELLAERYEQVHLVALPQWPGIHDDLTIWKVTT